VCRQHHRAALTSSSSSTNTSNGDFHCTCITAALLQIPTSVNFGGPKPEFIQVDPPPPEMLTGKNLGETPADASRGTFVELFRGSAPYLRMHRGATFVVHIPGEVLEGPCFQGVMDDIGLLSLLGIQLVLVVGSRPQTNSLMSRLEITPTYCGNLRVTTPATLKVCKEAAGYVRFEVESSLTRGQRGANSINVSGGNFFSAQPVGVRYACSTTTSSISFSSNIAGQC
jgi:hypothetical protein